MRQLVDENDFGLPMEDRRQVHLFERLALVGDGAAGKDLEVADAFGSLGAAVGLHESDDDVDALLAEGMRVLEHLVRLADAGRVPDVDLELSAAGLLEKPQEDVRRSAPGLLLRHDDDSKGEPGAPGRDRDWSGGR
jgi:hypothetical protein